MNRLRNASKLAAMYVTAAAATAHALSVQAGEHVYRVENPDYRQECGSCHIAYPPRLLSMASWHAVMGGLDRHFGTDASLEPPLRARILAFLALNSGDRETSAHGKPLLRITETRWFLEEHRKEIATGAAGKAGVTSMADCGACHTNAEKFDYAEAGLKVPGGRAR